MVQTVVNSLIPGQHGGDYDLNTLGADNAPGGTGDCGVWLQADLSAPSSQIQGSPRPRHPARVQRPAVLSLYMHVERLQTLDLSAEVFSHRVRVIRVPNDPRSEQYDQFGAPCRSRCISEQRANHRNLRQHRDPVSRVIGLVSDEAGKGDGLAILYDHRADQVTIVNRRRINRRRRRGRYIANFLINFKGDRTVRVDPRRHLKNDAGVAIFDAIDDRRPGTDHRLRRLDDDRNLRSDLEPGRLIVAYQQLG
jgi:hypothetical protein